MNLPKFKKTWQLKNVTISVQLISFFKNNFSLQKYTIEFSCLTMWNRVLTKTSTSCTLSTENVASQKHGNFGEKKVTELVIILSHVDGKMGKENENQWKKWWHHVIHKSIGKIVCQNLQNINTVAKNKKLLKSFFSLEIFNLTTY